MAQSKLNKLAVVVGASKGLGRAVSLRLAQEGMNIFAIARSEQALSQLKAELQTVSKANQEHQMLAADVSTPDGLKTVCQQLSSLPVSACVHLVGGTAGIRDPLFSYSDLLSVLKINLESALEINNVLIPQMKSVGYGRIVHVSSNAARKRAGAPSYGIAKAALNSYVEKLGAEFSPSGIGITAIMPGPIGGKDSLWDERLQQNPIETKKFINEALPLGRFQTPEELAELIGFLTSPAALSLSGTVLLADGNMAR